MTKLEEAARAIGRKRGDYGDETGWLGEETHRMALEEARAAIEALRLPTLDMVRAGARKAREMPQRELADEYTAMIDALLAETK